MEEPPIPDDEEKRLALLRACNIIYTPAEEAFDDLARLAAELCGTEIALITLVDSDYQWFKARVGVEQTVGKLLDVGNLDAAQGGLPYLALEYLEGTDLDRVIEERGRVPYRDAFAWCADACDGLAEAHGLGVVHRDLKPSNVFLAEQGEASVVKVLDFGIAAGEPAGQSPSANLVLRTRRNTNNLKCHMPLA